MKIVNSEYKRTSSVQKFFLMFDEFTGMKLRKEDDSSNSLNNNSTNKSPPKDISDKNKGTGSNDSNTLASSSSSSCSTNNKSLEEFSTNFPKDPVNPSLVNLDRIQSKNNNRVTKNKTLENTLNKNLNKSDNPKAIVEPNHQPATNNSIYSNNNSKNLQTKVNNNTLISLDERKSLPSIPSHLLLLKNLSTDNNNQSTSNSTLSTNSSLNNNTSSLSTTMDNHNPYSNNYNNTKSFRSSNASNSPTVNVNAIPRTVSLYNTQHSMNHHTQHFPKPTTSTANNNNTFSTNNNNPYEPNYSYGYHNNNTNNSSPNFNPRATVSFDISVQPKEFLDNNNYGFDDNFSGESGSNYSSNNNNMNFEALMSRQSFVSPSTFNGVDDDYEEAFRSFDSNKKVEFNNFPVATTSTNPNANVHYPLMNNSGYNNNNTDIDAQSINSMYNPNLLPLNNPRMSLSSTTNLNNIMNQVNIKEIEEDDDEDDVNIEDSRKLFDIIQLGLLDSNDFQILSENLCHIFDKVFTKNPKLQNNELKEKLLLKYNCKENISNLNGIISRTIIIDVMLMLLEKFKAQELLNHQNLEDRFNFLSRKLKELCKECLINLRQEYENMLTTMSHLEKVEEHSYKNSNNNNENDENVINNTTQRIDLVPRGMVIDKRGVERMLSQVQGNVNASLNGNGDTLVHAACFYGFKGTLEYLHKEKAANLNIRNKEGQLPLEYSINQHNVTCTLYLIGAGANIQLLSNEKLRSILVRDIIGEKKKNLTKAIYECFREDNKKIKVNVKDDYGLTPLHYAVTLKVDSAIKRILESPNLKINEQDKLKRTCLHLAAIVNNIDAISKLCKYQGCDKRLQDINGENFIHYYFRYFYSTENFGKYQNPIELIQRIQAEFKWFKHPIIDCAFLLSHAGNLDKLQQFKQFVIDCWNQIVQYGLKESYIIVDAQMIEGIITQDVVKYCIIETFKQFLQPPKKNHKRMYRMYWGTGLDTQLRKKGFLPGSQGKDANYYLKVKNYGSPNKNEHVFKHIVESGGRIYYINGKSVRLCVQTMNQYLIEAVYKGNIQEAKKDPRYDCGAQLELKRQENITIRYGKEIKNLTNGAIKQQVVDVTTLRTYTFSLIDYQDLQFLFTDLSQSDELSVWWTTNSNKQTPLSLAEHLIRDLLKKNAIEPKTFTALPLSAFVL